LHENSSEKRKPVAAHCYCGEFFFFEAKAQEGIIGAHNKVVFFGKGKYGVVCVPAIHKDGYFFCANHCKRAFGGYCFFVCAGGEILKLKHHTFCCEKRVLHAKKLVCLLKNVSAGFKREDEEIRIKEDFAHGLFSP